MEAIESKMEIPPEIVKITFMFDPKLQQIQNQFFYINSQKAVCSCLPNPEPREYFPFKGKEVSISLRKGKKVCEPFFRFIASEAYTVTLFGPLENIVCTLTQP